MPTTHRFRRALLGLAIAACLSVIPTFAAAAPREVPPAAPAAGGYCIETSWVEKQTVEGKLYNTGLILYPGQQLTVWSPENPAEVLLRSTKPFFVTYPAVRIARNRYELELSWAKVGQEGDSWLHTVDRVGAPIFVYAKSKSGVTRDLKVTKRSKGCQGLPPA